MLTTSRLSLRPDAPGPAAILTLSCFLSRLGKSASFGTGVFEMQSTWLEDDVLLPVKTVTRVWQG